MIERPGSAFFYFLEEGERVFFFFFFFFCFSGPRGSRAVQGKARHVPDDDALHARCPNPDLTVPAPRFGRIAGASVADLRQTKPWTAWAEFLFGPLGAGHDPRTRKRPFNVRALPCPLQMSEGRLCPVVRLDVMPLFAGSLRVPRPLLAHVNGKPHRPTLSELALPTSVTAICTFDCQPPTRRWSSVLPGSPPPCVFGKRPLRAMVQVFPSNRSA